MGCHTWCYRKITRSIEEAREIYLNRTKDSLVRWQRMLNDPEDRCRVAYNWTDEICQKQIDIMTRQIRMVEKGLCNRAVMRKQPGLTRFVNGSFYVEDDSLPHDLFRVGNYPETMLFSLQETLDFIKERSIEEVDMIQLFRFWNEYPDGMICFG